MSDALFDPRGLALLFVSAIAACVSARSPDPTPGSERPAAPAREDDGCADATGIWVAEAGPVLPVDLGRPDVVMLEGALHVVGDAHEVTLAPDRRAWSALMPIEPRAGASLAALDDGRLLRVGGAPLGLASTVDPKPAWVREVDGEWRRSGWLELPRQDANATVMNDGRVLVSGGRTLDGRHAIASAELWDPRSGTFEPVGSMRTPRANHAGIPSTGGQVLVVGGTNARGAALDSCELYDSDSRAWTQCPRLPEAAPLPDLAWSPTGKLLATTPSSLAVLEGPGGWSRVGSLQGSSALVIAPSRCEALTIGTHRARAWDLASTHGRAMGSPLAGRQRPALAFLDEDTLVVVGGRPVHDGGRVVEFWHHGAAPDPSSMWWSVVENVDLPSSTVVAERAGAAVARLVDGTVLASGGVRLDAQVPESEHPDPAALLGDTRRLSERGQPWTPLANPARRRWGATLTALPDGSAVLLGGFDDEGPVRSVERWHSGAATWFVADSRLPHTRVGHTSTAVSDGILVVGACRVVIRDPTWTIDVAAGGASDAVLWRRRDETIVDAGSTQTPRCGHFAVSLDDGRVLVAGGWRDGTFASWFGPSGSEALASAELWDPTTRTWSAATPMNEPRAEATATRLPDGRVLVVGGQWPSPSTLPTAELYDPAVDRWAVVGTLPDSWPRVDLLVQGDERVVLVTDEVTLELRLPPR